MLKKFGIIACFIGFTAHLLASPFMKMSEEEVREASRSMSTKEAQEVESFLRRQTSEGEGDLDEELEKLFQAFYKGRYDLVIEELRSLGINPQRVLRDTGLRIKMLESKLEKVPWFIKEIAGLSYFLEKDALLPQDQKKWPTLNDRAQYLVYLSSELCAYQERVEDETDRLEAIEILLGEFEQIQEFLSPVFRDQIEQAKTRIEDIL